MKNWRPNKIPINREIGDHTHYIGKTKDGIQFFCYHTFYFPNDYDIGHDWEDIRKEYAVIHLFDLEGNHIQSRHQYLGTTNASKHINLTQVLEEMVRKLDNPIYENIVIKPFKVTIDNIVFGLIDDEEFESFELMPSSTIAFFEPWDGEYDT